MVVPLASPTAWYLYLFGRGRVRALSLGLIEIVKKMCN